MDFEEQLSHQLGQDAERLSPPITAIVAEADRQGRKLRHRRRLQIAGSVTAVAALVTTGTALGLQHGPAPAAAIQLAAPATGGTPTPGTPTAGTAPLSSDAMLAIASGLLPANTKLTNYKPGQPDWAKLPGATSFSVEADNGQGPIWITLSVRDHVTGLPATDCTSDCTPGTLEGSTIQVIGDSDNTTDCSPVEIDIKHVDQVAIRMTLIPCVSRSGALVPTHKSQWTLAPWATHVTISHNWLPQVPSSLAAEGAELAKKIPVVN